MSGCPFDVGDVVVCVNKARTGQSPQTDAALDRLCVGKSYRVLRIGADGFGNIGIDIGLPNRDLWPGFNDIWPAWLFRKIDDDVTDAFREQMRSLGKPARIPELVGTQSPRPIPTDRASYGSAMINHGRAALCGEG